MIGKVYIKNKRTHSQKSVRIGKKHYFNEKEMTERDKELGWRNKKGMRRIGGQEL